MRSLIAGLLLLPASACATVRYVLIASPQSQSFGVTVSIDRPRSVETFSLPAWTPGLYKLQTFEEKLSEPRAYDRRGKSLTITKVGPRTWKVARGRGAINFTYRVTPKNPNLGFVGTSIFPSVAFVNGPAAFVYLPNRLAERVSLKVYVPNSWRVSLNLPRGGTGLYTAANYEEMVDSPIQMGEFQRRVFTVEGRQFEAVFVTKPGEVSQLNVDKTVSEIRTVCRPALRMMKRAPFSRYQFLFHVGATDFFGGLEHRSGCVLDVPNKPNLDLTRFFCHEFFHVWNAKEIRPRALAKIDFSQACRTKTLWFAEGVTEYFAKRHCYQSGAKDSTWLLDAFSREIRRYQRGKTRKEVTVEDASWFAWEHGGFNYGDLDYYNKGSLIGLLMDAAIRNETGGDRSMDDVIKYLRSEYPLSAGGYPEDGVLTAINDVSSSSLNHLYNTAVRSTAELPYGLLRHLGLFVRNPDEGSFEAPFHLTNGRIDTMTDAAVRAGLHRGDEFLYYKAGASNNVGTVVVNRGDTTATFHIQLVWNKPSRFELIIDPKPSAESSKRLQEWLRRP